MSETKKRKSAPQQKQAPSPEPVIEIDKEYCEAISPRHTTTEEPQHSPSIEHRPSVFEEEALNQRQGKRRREEEGLSRPPEAGFRLPQQERKSGHEWVDDYAPSYGHTPSFHRDQFRRHWSPVSFGGGRDYEGRLGEYGNRGGLYDTHLPFNDCREAYYDGRGRELDRRGREYEERGRYEDSRYSLRPQHSGDMYAPRLEPPTAFQNARNAWRGGSPPPSSSAAPEINSRSYGNERRPLHVDKHGIPEGQMVALFHADIQSFVKDMDPTCGWDGQMKEAKQRLYDRIMKDYRVYGESTRLSEKYLKKEAGAALIQFRYSLNVLIDRGLPKPDDLEKRYWDALVAIRKTEEAQLKSAKMASIARGHGSKNTTKRALEHSVVLKLARDLKRDPYATEVQEVVEKEWAVVQEAAGERKRVRALTNASNAATEATKALEKRLEVLEKFVVKWEPEFVNWTSQNPELLQLPSSTMSDENAAAENELALVAANAHLHPTNDIEEDEAVHTSDKEDCTSNKSSAEEESHSADENAASDSDNVAEQNLHPLSIVEPEEEVVPTIHRVEPSVGNGPKTKKPVLASKIVAIAPKGPMRVGTASVTLGAIGKGKQPLKAVKSTPIAIISKVVPKKAVAQVSGSTGKEETDGVTTVGTRKKPESNSADAPLLLDEEATPDKPTGNEVLRKKTTKSKRNDKPPEAKGNSKGVKRRK